MKRMWKILLGLSLLAYALCLSPMVHAGIRIVHPSLYVIAVGINKYQERSFPPLKYATADAQEFANAMQRLWPGAAVTKLVLLDETATRDSIEAAFNRVILKADPYDTFVFHYAGMGFHRKARFIKGASEFFLYPSDFVDSEDEKSPSFRGISSTLIQTWCSKIQARNQLIVLDACDSGEDFNTFTSRVIGQSGGLSELLGKSVLILGTSGITGESEELGHGHLTSALLQGLHGEGDYDPKDGTITAKELESYFYSRYAQLAIASHLNGRPASFSVGRDFIVGRLASKDTSAALPSIAAEELEPSFPATSDTSARGSRPIEATQPKPVPARNGSDYALLIATDNYDELSPLKNPVYDAQQIGHDLENYYNFKVDLVRNPTRAHIKATLHEYLRKQFAEGDQLFVFVAGHGVFDEVLNQGYIATKDSKRPDEFKDTYISHSDLRNIIDRIPCNHILLTLDVCFGGTFDSGIRADDMYADISRPEFIARKLQYKTRLFLTSGGKEYVPDGRPGYHSPFARKLLEALRTYGGHDGLLTFSKVYAHLEAINPEPRKGEFGENEPGSDFLFIAN